MDQVDFWKSISGQIIFSICFIRAGLPRKAKTVKTT